MVQYMVPLILFKKSHTHGKTNNFVFVLHVHAHTHFVNQHDHLILGPQTKIDGFGFESTSFYYLFIWFTDDLDYESIYDLLNKLDFRHPNVGKHHEKY